MSMLDFPRDRSHLSRVGGNAVPLCKKSFISRLPRLKRCRRRHFFHILFSEFFFPYLFVTVNTPMFTGTHIHTAAGLFVPEMSPLKATWVDHIFYCSLSKPTMTFENKQSTRIDCTFVSHTLYSSPLGLYYFIVLLMSTLQVTGTRTNNLQFNFLDYGTHLF